MTERARPTCAVCLRPVERIEERVDDHLDRLEIRVFCHGQVQRVVLLPGETPRGVEAGLAFVAEGPPRLAP